MRTSPLLFLDHTADLGGAERSLLLIFRHLNRRKWAPHLACPEGVLAEEASKLGVDVHVFDFPRLRRSTLATADWIAGARKLAKITKESGAELVVSNTVRSTFYGALAAKLASRPFAWYMRDFWLGESKPRCPWLDTSGKRFLCALSTIVIANSHATAAHVPCRDKVVVIHNGIEVARFDTTMDGTPFRREHGIPESAPLVGTVGRLRPWKGQDRFLRVFAEVLRRMPDVWGVIVGGAIFGVRDGYEERLHRLVDDLGIANRVLFTGHLSDTLPALAAMDVFVHPGDPEPFGLVNVEAMAMGKPVVAFSHGALPEIVVDGETGILVPPGDISAMVDAIVSLLTDRSTRDKMGRAGRQRVEKFFDIRGTVSEIESVFEEVTK